MRGLRITCLRFLFIGIFLSLALSAQAAITSLRGTISNANTSQPISGASISLYDGAGILRKTLRTDAQGFFRVSAELKNPTKITATIENPGFVTKTQSATLQPGKTYTVNVKLVPQDITPPTGSISINSGSAYANSLSVTLSLTAQDAGSGVSQMQFSNNGSSWSGPEAFVLTKTWALANGDGLKTVYVKFRDTAGNWSTGYSDTITLDTIPPQVVISSPEDGAVTVDAQVQLTGTVDSAPFYEARTLTAEGPNTLTKSAADPAGNSASKSITVYYSPGRLIGPEGGEVSSYDGSIQAIIPAGALSAATRISILPVDSASLQGSIPGGYALLSAARFYPSGLVFSQPINLVYTLRQAEVPGTPVRLAVIEEPAGLMRAFMSAPRIRLSSGGESTVIPPEGNTLQFSVGHFSTYAALKALVPSSAPIGFGVKMPLPDLLTGAFSHSIAITVPPGRKGIQPSLALNYRSGNANSWTGVGFSLNPGYIVRSTRLGPPSYNDAQDTFYLVTDAGSTELVNLTGNLYQAKIESSFARFYKETNNSWRVLSKEGSRMYFGENADSREAGSGGTFAWYLTKTADTNGNYVEYSYTKDAGKSYLSRIDYTGNDTGASPTHQVSFTTESRTDPFSSYISGSRISTTKRLKAIEARVRGSLVWTYELEYTYSTDTNRSLLSSVTQKGHDDKALPTQTFIYQHN